MDSAVSWNATDLHCIINSPRYAPGSFPGVGTRSLRLFQQNPFPEQTAANGVPDKAVPGFLHALGLKGVEQAESRFEEEGCGMEVERNFSRPCRGHPEDLMLLLT